MDNELAELGIELNPLVFRFAARTIVLSTRINLSSASASSFAGTGKA
jgi:hypothetical protein